MTGAGLPTGLAAVTALTADLTRTAPADGMSLRLQHGLRYSPVSRRWSWTADCSVSYAMHLVAPQDPAAQTEPPQDPAAQTEPPQDPAAQTEPPLGSTAV